MIPSTNRLPPDWTAPAPLHGGTVEARVLRRVHARAVERVLRAAQDPAAAQAEAADRVLASLRGTALARRYGVGSATGLDGLRAAAPIRRYEADADLFRREAAGERRVVTSEPITGFVRTSGTTGDPKVLPVTRSQDRDVADAQAAWLVAMIAEQPEIARGYALASYSADRAGGAGANTARVAGGIGWLARSRLAVPAWVHGLDDPDLRTYTCLRVALGRDVRSWTTANPSTVLAWCRAIARWREELAADLADGTLRRGPAGDLSRAARLALAPVLRRRTLPADPRPGRIWDLRAVNCWKGGAAAFFVDRLPAALGAPVTVREVGIAASEGTIAVALHSSWWGGVAWAGGPVIELLPEGATDTVGLEEAEIGRDYGLVVSTTAGLLRYDLNDVVRVEGRYGRAPVLRFLRKGRDVLSVTGEKVTADQAVLAAREALPGVEGFAVGVAIGDRSVYELFVEGEPPALAAERFDARLRRLNEEYDAKRASDRLGDVRLVVVPSGSFARYRAERLRAGAADGQVKDLVLVDGADRDRLAGGWP